MFAQVVDRHGGVEGSPDGERALVDHDVRRVQVMGLPRPGLADDPDVTGGA